MKKAATANPRPRWCRFRICTTPAIPSANPGVVQKAQLATIQKRTIACERFGANTRSMGDDERQPLARLDRGESSVVIGPLGN
jgi:hypothetical protein